MKPAGRGLEPGGRPGARRHAPRLGAANGSRTRSSARAVSAPAQSRSHGVWYGRKALGPGDRTATEVRVRFPKWISAFQAEPNVRSGIRTRNSMLNRHVLSTIRAI